MKLLREAIKEQIMKRVVFLKAQWKKFQFSKKIARNRLTERKLIKYFTVPESMFCVSIVLHGFGQSLTYYILSLDLA